MSSLSSLCLILRLGLLCHLCVALLHLSLILRLLIRLLRQAWWLGRRWRLLLRLRT